jgi:hypothetical protein
MCGESVKAQEQDADYFKIHTYFLSLLTDKEINNRLTQK